MKLLLTGRGRPDRPEDVGNELGQPLHTAYKVILFGAIKSSEAVTYPRRDRDDDRDEYREVSPCRPGRPGGHCSAGRRGPGGRGADGQRDMLRAVLRAYLGRVPDGLSPQADYAGDAVLDRVYFAWAGPTGPGQPLYYRLQGPRLLIEYDNVQRHANHAHSVWRDPESDFGCDALGAHLAEHHL
jgi:hypothetical protein